jgi:hypothetical protein
VTSTLDEAVTQQKDTSQPVRARVGDIAVEVRAVVEARGGVSAADVFKAFGPWEGEATAEMLDVLAEARRTFTQARARRSNLADSSRAISTS